MYKWNWISLPLNSNPSDLQYWMETDNKEHSQRPWSKAVVLTIFFMGAAMIGQSQSESHFYRKVSKSIKSYIQS